MWNLITAGFFKGNRTYILGCMMALQAFVSWLVGEITLFEFMEQLPEILTGLGLVTLRAGVK